MRRGNLLQFRSLPFGGLSIRQKLLLVITGLLSLSAVLSLLLHLDASQKASRKYEVAVEEIVERLSESGLISTTTAAGSGLPSSESLSPIDGSGSSLGAGSLGSGMGDQELSSDVFVPTVHHGPEGMTVTLEHRLDEISVFDDPVPVDPLDTQAVIPPPKSRVIAELRDPIEATREESLPREIGIAGAVLLVGFVLTWLVASRLTRPIKTLRSKMDAVARGELDEVSSSRSGSASKSSSRDELSQMTTAFDTMVESLREKRAIEKKIFQAERLSALGDLAAGVAHDVRNPLNTIGLSLSHLRDQCSPSDVERRESFERILDDVKGELGRLNDLVHNFLSLARDGGSDGQEGTETCELRLLVDECLRLVRKQAQSQDIVLREYLTDVGTLEVNSLELRRAVTNVVLNALQALESGGDIVVRLSSCAGGVVLEISDNGRGMTADELDKAFLPYYTTRPEGTGLGLPLARGVVEAHGGTLTIRSESGRGTTVEIILPRARPASAKPAPQSHSSASQRPSAARGEFTTSAIDEESR
jgi:signal transduction histidine kinase